LNEGPPAQGGHEGEGYPRAVVGAAAAGDRRGRTWSWVAPRLQLLLEVLGLTALAVTQPVLSVFGESPETFVTHATSRRDIVLFALIVAVVPALVIWLVEVAALQIHPRAAQVARFVVVGGLVGSFALQVLKEATDVGYKRIAVVGAVIGLGAAVLHLRVAAVRSWLRVLALASVAFVLVFLFASPVSDLLFPSGGNEAGAEVGRPADVVVLVFDELPLDSFLDEEGDIDAESFPNFARLADQSTWYRNSTTVSPHTDEAVPSILSGSWPSGEDAPTVSNYPNNIFTLLQDTYELHAVESTTRLCEEDCTTPAEGRSSGLRPLLGDAADVWWEKAEPDRSEGQIDFDVESPDDEAAGERFEAFIDGLGDSPRPRLDVAHLFLPHQEWRFLPDGHSYESPMPPRGFLYPAWVDDVAAETGRQPHQLQLAYTDLLLGRMIDRMEELGTWDDSLVVVTSDHGAAFEGGEPMRFITERNYPHILWTPLFVKAPGQGEGELDERHVRAIDVLPTIADHLDIDLPFEVDGQSALAPGFDVGDDPRVHTAGALAVFLPGEEDFFTFDGPGGYRDVLGSGPRVAPGDDELRLFRHGDFGALVGRRVDGLEVDDPSGREVVLRENDDFGDVDPDAEQVPAYLSGEVRGEDELVVAVALNGVVGGWARTTPGGVDFDEPERPPDADSRQQFHVVLPRSVLRAGDNDLEAFLVEGPPDDATLVPLRVSASL
jgi:hypothetical protein